MQQRLLSVHRRKKLFINFVDFYCFPVVGRTVWKSLPDEPGRYHRRVILTTSNSSPQQSFFCLAFNSVTSTSKTFFNFIRYTDSRIIYLLTFTYINVQNISLYTC